MKTKKHIAVLVHDNMGEVNASQATARDVFKTIQEMNVPCSLVSLAGKSWRKTCSVFDENTVCFLATHGGFGEDGTLQSYLEEKNIRHTHSSAETCRILIDKHATKQNYKTIGIPTPLWICCGEHFSDSFHEYSSRRNSFLKKPRFGGSKIGIHKIFTNQINGDADYIFEEIIPGMIEVSIIVLRDKEVFIPLYPIIRKRTSSIGELYDLDDSYINEKIKEKCSDYAMRIASYLNCYGIIKTDFLIDKNEKIWAIETDAIPGLSKKNAASNAAQKSAMTYKTLLQKIIDTCYRTTI